VKEKFRATVAERLATEPVVETVAVAWRAPFFDGLSTIPVTPAPDTDRVRAGYTFVSSEYFQNFRIPLSVGGTSPAMKRMRKPLLRLLARPLRGASGPIRTRSDGRFELGRTPRTRGPRSYRATIRSGLSESSATLRAALRRPMRRPQLVCIFRRTLGRRERVHC